MLCAGRVLVVPIHTTAAVCSTAVRSSLGSARPPQWSQTQAYASNVYWFTPVSSCCSRQTQGVVGMALNRRRELRVRCTASASRSSAEAASSVLSTSPESWIACVGRGNSSTRHFGGPTLWWSNPLVVQPFGGATLRWCNPWWSNPLDSVFKKELLDGTGSV